MDYSLLINKALEARKKAYAPYSKWAVGAALLCKDQSIYLGCNIENSGFTSTVCAERVAFFKAISEGESEFAAIAIVGGDVNTDPAGYCYPCGVCRQVMCEFADPDDFKIITARNCDDYVVYSLREMIPHCGYVKGHDEDSHFFKVK